MTRILVSACLLGRKVRHDGSDKAVDDPAIARWQREGRLVPVCPEVAAGFPTPRPAAEIDGAGGGDGVLDGRARVVETTGADVTASFIDGAHVALSVAQQHGCTHALLTDASPSCGSRAIHDGTFGGGKTAGMGVTTALLRRHGIKVFAHTQIEELERSLRTG